MAFEFNFNFKLGKQSIVKYFIIRNKLFSSQNTKNKMTCECNFSLLDEHLTSILFHAV